MNASREEILTHATTYHRFLTAVRWVVLWLAASLATIILIFARAGVLPALIGGSLVFAVFAYVSKRIFLNPHEHEAEDMAARAAGR